MKRFLPHLSSVILVTLGVLLGSTLVGTNTVAQKLSAVTGVGTQDHFAKWVNNSGSLGNSSITEDKFGNLTIAGSIKFADGTIQSSAGAANLSGHHQELTLVAQPSESPSFVLPKTDFPVRIDISTSVIVEHFPFCNNPGFGTTTSGPLFMNGVVALDSSTGRISVTTSSRAEAEAFWRADLKPDHATQRMVISVVTDCPNPSCCNNTPQFVTSGPITYHVSMWY